MHDNLPKWSSQKRKSSRIHEVIFRLLGKANSPAELPRAAEKKSPQMKYSFRPFKNSRWLDGRIFSSSEASSLLVSTERL
jgi:hypothetical protein